MQIEALLSVLSLSALAAAGGDFAASCTDIDLISGHTLNALCYGDGFKERSFLDLNKCYATIEDGSIVPRKDGGFYGRCKSCAVTLKGILMCTCEQAEGFARTVQVDLNEHISNINGHTHCDVEDGGYDGSCYHMWNGEVECDDARVTN
ncbi:Cyanovirin-N [Aspergillus steynii IBT 23096]|uniref:Cyanovirin-N n=1 Tax=Aspergillus steynii IBT 23096 TaxID=1392250 RepID=A0A2I2GKP3_9EURO|nr:Cyanovirin-N [Aspergillus steynii IBT 23096]PLB53417.1 Cyanovirin-N [Aspergillus steynii IBT 23096]